MTGIETLRSFVNAWDCDENDHLNIQGYFTFFEDAADHFLLHAGLGEGDRAAALTRHVRFHDELRSGQVLRAASHAARSETSGCWHLVHELREAATGRLAATALDTFEGGAREAALALADGAVPSEAAPRSIAPGPAILVAGAAGIATHRGRLGVHEMRPDGAVLHRAAVARFSDAAAHLWESIGVSEPWLSENDYGRVALELKVTRGATMRPGLVHVLSAPTGAGGRTITFRHLLVASDSGAVVAVGEVTGLLIDRRARRSIPLPESVREAAQARAAG